MNNGPVKFASKMLGINDVQPPHSSVATQGFDSCPTGKGLLEDCRYPLAPARGSFLFPFHAQFTAENSL